MRTCASCDLPASHWGRCAAHYADLPAAARARRKAVLHAGNNGAAELRKSIRGTLVRCAGCKGLYVASQVDVDHILPLYQGGTDSAENVQILCRATCHRAKTDMDAGRAPF